jgi:hypothetical protein
MLFVHPILAQYLDPGAGSYIFQLAIAGFTALVFFFSYRMKATISKFFRLLRKDDGTK